MTATASVSFADPNYIRAAYWDIRYPAGWTNAEFLRDVLEFDGYEMLDADQLKTWMDARIADELPSVVVFCRDIAPDTVAESMSAACTLRQYLNAGGKIVWFADIPLYYQGHSDGTSTVWGTLGSTNILGLNAAGAPWDGNQQVTFTTDGVDWGLTETWLSNRPALNIGVRVLATDNSGYQAAWVKHYVPNDTYRGFARLFDTPGTPNFNDVRRVAEYPNVPDPLILDSQIESDDDIIAAFYYPWYRNLSTSGFWHHWNSIGIPPDYTPPTTWSAYYLPNYPDSTWNPAVQLYDVTDVELLRWQDHAMAQAGIDIAIASWWGIGNYEDLAFAQAIRICKNVQWCIYYENEAYGDPTSQQIHDDIKYVLDNYTPTHNYAKIDGKWLVLIYGAAGTETADRWRQAKALLAASGYDVYFNADTYDASAATAPAPWDAVHRYNPVVYQGLTNTLPNVDDSAWISPGFWRVPEENPRLDYSLSEFTAAWNNIVANKQSSRFILIETWNEWHEGTQIEPGQEIVPDPCGFYLSGYNYDYDFIDTIGPDAVQNLHWLSCGHRLSVPALIQAEEMVWELGTSPQDSHLWRISDADARIGSSVLVVNPGDLVINVNCRGEQVGPSAAWPELVLYFDDTPLHQWILMSSTFQDYSTVVSTTSGIHKIELALVSDPGGSFDVDIVVDFVSVCSPIDADLSQNCFVDETDVFLFANQWLQTNCGTCQGADLTGDGHVKLNDLALFATRWLSGINPFDL